MNKPTKLVPYLFSLGLAVSTLFIASCSKDDDATSIIPAVEIPTDFDSRTPAQHKTQLEDNGIAMVNNLTEMQNTPAVQTTASFNYFLAEADLPENGRGLANNKAVKMLALLGQLGIGKANASDVLKGFRTNEEEEPGTPQEVFDDYKGTYTYNTTTDTWAYTANADKILFKFPSTEAGTVNNAEFAIYGYTSQQVNNVDAEYEGDVPTGLKADLSVGGTKQMEYNFAASYKTNGEPTSVTTSLTLGAFKFAFNALNNTSEVAVDYSLTENSTNIISFGAGASGDFSSGSLADENGGANAINDGTAYFQIMNVKFAGNVQIASLADALENATTVPQEAAAFNSNLTLVVFYADTKTKIADSEFYVTTRTEEYQSCWWNEDTQTYDCETMQGEPEDVVDVRLVFNDGSKSDLETYTDIGFEDVEEAFDDFATAVEEDFN